MTILCWVINFSCAQISNKENLNKVKVDPNLEDEFFKSKAYSESVSSLQVYRNDSLISEVTNVEDPKVKKVVNAFVADKFDKRFGLNRCIGMVNKDTTIIELRSNALKDYLLSLKIFDGYFISNFTESKMPNSDWTPIKEKLTLNTINFKTDQEVKGLIEIEFVKTKNSIEIDSVLFYGPFYFMVPEFKGK